MTKLIFLSKNYVIIWKIQCIFINLTLANATCWNLSNASSFSSPVCPFCCPLRILAAVTVVSPIPSPINNMMFLATAVLSTSFRFFRSCIFACWYQYSGPSSNEINVIYLFWTTIRTRYKNHTYINPWTKVLNTHIFLIYLWK